MKRKTLGTVTMQKGGVLALPTKMAMQIPWWRPGVMINYRIIRENGKKCLEMWPKTNQQSK